MGQSDNDAATSLHLLDTYYRQHPDTGPALRRSTAVTPGTPLNVGIVDYIDRCISEVVDHTRAEAPTPTGPVPARVADIYDWYREHTADAGPEVQLRRDIVIYRHRLEHAIQLGEYKAVCKHPCPACGTWGLQWDEHTRRALCINHHCRDRHGMARRWTLARLATQYVMSQEENREHRAT